MKPELNVGRRSSRKYFLLHHHPLLCEASFLDYSKKKNKQTFLCVSKDQFLFTTKGFSKVPKGFYTRFNLFCMLHFKNKSQKSTLPSIPKQNWLFLLNDKTTLYNFSNAFPLYWFETLQKRTTAHTKLKKKFILSLIFSVYFPWSTSDYILSI